MPCKAIDRGTAPPLVLGFSLFIEHALVERTFASYQRLFPESDIRPSPQCTAQLLAWLGDGEINAALVTTPVKANDLVIQPIARERLLLCLRKDDPVASADVIQPRQIAGKLTVTFDPKQHPELFSYIDSTLSRAETSIGVSAGVKIDHVTPLPRRNVVYFYSGAYTSSRSRWRCSST